MNYEEKFLKVLEENEDDWEARMVYADWLEEEAARPEEAERQRKWPAAKAKLVELVGRYNAESADPGCYLTYELLLEIGRSAHEGYPSVGNMMGLRDDGYLDQEFWENWSIVTGLPIPYAEDGELPFFRCAC